MTCNFNLQLDLFYPSLYSSPNELKMTKFSPSFVLHLKLQMSCLHSRSWTVCYLFTYADDAAAHHHLMLLTSYECKAASKMRGKKASKLPQYISHYINSMSLYQLYEQPIQPPSRLPSRVQLRPAAADETRPLISVWLTFHMCLWIPARHIFIKGRDPA